MHMLIVNMPKDILSNGMVHILVECEIFISEILNACATSESCVKAFTTLMKVFFSLIHVCMYEINCIHILFFGAYKKLNVFVFFSLVHEYKEFHFN